MKVFISQPMLGRSDEEIKIERDAIIKDLENKGFEVIDSMIAENAPETSQQGAWYLGESIKLLSGADFAYFAKGWDIARGCRIEHAVAEEYDIKILWNNHDKL
jgi:hypothetical protein